MSGQHRPIRSYVRREGRLTRRQGWALETLWQHYVLEPTSDNFNIIFQEDREITLEIGFGMGQSLAKMAANAPEQLFIGVEVHRPGVGALLAEIASQKLTNLFIVCMDAKELLQAFIADNTLSRVLVLFPDPWPKKRHHKRRLIQPAFVQQLAMKLKPGGVLHLATDWQPYATAMLETVNCSPYLQNNSKDAYFVSKEGLRTTTKFESRGIRLGHGIYDIISSRKLKINL